MARAAIDRFTDGMFALDHQKAEAYLMDSCESDTPNAKPWIGIAAELLPHGYSHQVDNLSGVSIRLHGAPFNGSRTYLIP